MGLIILRCSEVQDAYFASRDRFSSHQQEADDAAGDALRLELEIQLVARMVVEPEGRLRKLFADADKVRTLLQPDQVEYFIAQHMLIQTDQVDRWALDRVRSPEWLAIARAVGLPEDSPLERLVLAVQAQAEAVADDDQDEDLDDTPAEALDDELGDDG